MRIFIIGMPGSGRTTVAKALCQDEKFRYIDCISWVKGTFRDQKPGEHPDQYHDAYHHWYLNRVREDPFLGTDNVWNSINAYNKDVKADEDPIYVIDGVNSPMDFSDLFDFNYDIVVFLNRTDNDTPHKDYENIGVSVMRDQCFWMSAAELLPRERWLEYNFKMVAPDADHVKCMGSKNSVFVVRNLNKVISHLREILNQLILRPEDESQYDQSSSSPTP